MAFDVLSSTTLSAALNDEDVNFAVASTTNVSVGDILVVNGEAMKVQVKDDPSSGYVTVMRGVLGTRARSHASAKKVWIADPDDLIRIKKGAESLGLDASAGNFPGYMLPGSRAKDADGNEYVMVELTAEVYSGVTVLISRDGAFTAAPAVTATQGSIGVMAEPATSDQFAWAQIYGYFAAALEAGGTSAATSAYSPVAATSVSTPDAGMAAVVTSSADIHIRGMFIVGAAVSTTTSTTSNTGVTVPVWLNYPWVPAAAYSIISS